MQNNTTNSTQIRTRFAPSPTGYLHVGGARTALFSWAFARHYNGKFILRIEDTDLERSTPEATQAILDGMAWLDLTHDEGPFYQTQHFDRYKTVIQEMLANGTAYYCYMSKEELEALREGQKARGEKERYDGRYRPEPGKTLPSIPEGVNPVVRFKNPKEGSVTWHDLVKGDITIANEELDDLIIARADGTPTYNFCVVVDDWDMNITHVIRGDDHVNNTPRQINILKALGASLPTYAHVPMILGSDGQKLSKRHGAVSVMEYDKDGFLPEALCNYLARLGWAHGDDEIFNREQFVAWFDGNHLSTSASQFDPAKLLWLNNHYIKQADNQRLANLVAPRIKALDITIDTQPHASNLANMIGLVKDRCNTLNEITQNTLIFFQEKQANSEELATHLSSQIQPAIKHFAEQLQTLSETDWTLENIKLILKQTLTTHQLKMPQLAMPIRLLLTGQLQTPAIDAVIYLFGKQMVIARLKTI